MRTLLAAVLTVGLGGLAYADDAKPDPVGTWKWETEFNGQKRQSTLKLKKDGDKLAGVMVGRDNTETKIEDVKYKDGDLSFVVNRERDGQKFSIKYKAKIKGDTIKGEAEADFGGETRKFEFEGKREKADK
ncbi:MAG: hypothetical protein U0871_02130 [Gemmataceae bacterium]